MKDGTYELRPEGVAQAIADDPIGWTAGVVTGYVYDDDLGSAALLVATLSLGELQSLALRLAVRLAAEMKP